MDLALTNGLILTQNKQRQVIEHGTVVIRRNKIVSVTDRYKPRKNTRTIDLRGRLVMPGLIDAHVHLGEIIYRGQVKPGDTKSYIEQTERIYQTRYAGKKNNRSIITDYAVLQLIKSGTTTIVGGRTWPTAEALGVRNISGYMVMNSLKLQRYYGNLALNVKEYRSALKRSKLSEPCIFIHSLNFIDPKKLSEISTIRRRFPKIKIFIHVAESSDLDRQVIEQYGKSTIRVLVKNRLLNDHTFLIHGLFIDPADWRLIKKSGVHIISCPSSNWRLEKRILDLRLLKKNGIPIMIGTDGPSPNGPTSLLREIRRAYLYNRRAWPNRVVAAQELLDITTVNAARALGQPRQLGSIEVGKLADIIVIDSPLSTVRPGKSVTEKLVFGPAKKSVHLAVINGRMVYYQGKLNGRPVRTIVSRYMDVRYG